jgi:hypothetical protein
VTIAANGTQVAVVRPISGQEIVIDFEGVAGKNLVTLAYSRWNHHPDEFAPQDPRPFAVAFRTVRCDAGQEKHLLFSL